MAPEEQYMDTMIDCFRKYISCFRNNNKEGGYVFGYGTDKPGDVIATPAMNQFMRWEKHCRYLYYKKCKN